MRLLVTQDAPHRGANVPLGFQAMVNDLAPYRLTKIGLASYGVVGTIVGSFIEMRDILPELEQAEELLDEPASRQLLLVQDGSTNTFLDGNYRSMVTFGSGYSPSFVMRALANGSECGVGQIVTPGSELFFANADLFTQRLLFAIPNLLIGTTMSAIHPGASSIIKASLQALIPFTGKHFKTQFRVRAAPSSGTNEAFNGSVVFAKKILALIPVDISLFNSSRNSPAGALAWDSAPGGYYWLHANQAKIPGTNLNAYPILTGNLTVRLAKLFNFVPTVSALDITTTPVTPQALISPFTGGSNASFPSRFANFITQERDPGEQIGSINNSPHIQFTARNANWLFNQMQGVNEVVNCSYFCSGTATSPYISGPAEICGGQVPYTLNNPSSATNFTWSNSSNLIYVSGQGSQTYTVSKGSDGSASVQVVLDGGCGNSSPFSKSISPKHGRLQQQRLSGYRPEQYLH